VGWEVSVRRPGDLAVGEELHGDEYFVDGEETVDESVVEGCNSWPYVCVKMLL
jgi:hypothetical protein